MRRRSCATSTRTNNRRHVAVGTTKKSAATTGKEWAIRWREVEITPDGTARRALRYERLEPMSRRQASEILAQKLAAVSGKKAPIRSRVTFRTLANEWQTTVLPMYKHSTQKHRRFMLAKHLLPRFGDKAVCEITRQEIQVYVARPIQKGYVPKSIDHIHDVLSAVLRTAVKWGHLPENPARGVDLPKLKTVRPKWALTLQQAAALLKRCRPWHERWLVSRSFRACVAASCSRCGGRTSTRSLEC